MNGKEAILVAEVELMERQIRALELIGDIEICIEQLEDRLDFVIKQKESEVIAEPVVSQYTSPLNCRLLVCVDRLKSLLSDLDF